VKFYADKKPFNIGIALTSQNQLVHLAYLTEREFKPLVL
jgi:hypothetical protein